MVPDRAALIIAILAGCGDGGGSLADASSCNGDCVPGWWTVVTGPCDVCQLEPQPRECDESDCDALDAHEFRDTGAHGTMWTAHSPSARTFTVILILPESAWSIAQPCDLEAEYSCTGRFTCEADAMQFFACQGPYDRPSLELESALSAAYTAGPGEYAY